MAIVSAAEYRDTPYTKTTDGEKGVLQIDQNGNLRVRNAPAFREQNQNVAGATSTYGKIGTVAASATTIVGVCCEDWPVTWVDWAVSFDNSWNYYLARSNSPATSGTLTLTDATAVDDGDTFVLNGLTFTAEATESDASAAARKYWLGNNNAEAAVNLTALLNDATYGVPGFVATCTPVAATDVITLASTGTSTGATCIQFGQGTSASNEIAFAETTQAYLDKQSYVSGKTTTAGWAYEAIQNHYIDGWGWAYLVIVNAEASTATLDVRATRV